MAEAAVASPGRILQVAMPIFPDMTSLDLIGPYEPLHMLPNVRVVLVSHRKGLVAADPGVLSLEATATFDEVPSPDVIVVPGGKGTNAMMTDKPLIAWLRKAHETSLYTTSVCTGSMLLGAAGILKGVEATTHWIVMETLRKFGATPVNARVVQQGKVITAAGVSAGIDMGLKLVALLADETTAKVAQLILEYDPQPPFACGSPGAAGPELVAIAHSMVEALAPEIMHPGAAILDEEN